MNRAVKVARNIVRTRSGTYSVRIIRAYLRARLQRNFTSLRKATAWRNQMEKLHPVTPRPRKP